VNRFAVLCLAVGTLGCHGKADAPLSVHGFVGTELAAPLPKPDASFTDTRGRSFRFDSATRDKVTLVFFGYTNCPDVCPVHLANLAAVLEKMPDSVASHVAVVFVTTDPARDSAAVIDHWVHGFSPEFIGLTASDSIINAAQTQLKLQTPVKGATDASGKYPVAHAAPVIAFTRDGKGRVAYAPGTRQRDWAHDLPLLVAYGR
jgi:protein SCO1/2